MGPAAVPKSKNDNNPIATKIHPNPHLTASDSMRAASTTTSASGSHYYTTKKCEGVPKLIVP